MLISFGDPERVAAGNELVKTPIIAFDAPENRNVRTERIHLLQNRSIPTPNCANSVGQTTWVGLLERIRVVVDEDALYSVQILGDGPPRSLITQL